MAKLVSKVYGDAYVSVVSEKNNLIDALEEIKSVKNILLENVVLIKQYLSMKFKNLGYIMYRIRLGMIIFLHMVIIF